MNNIMNKILIIFIGIFSVINLNAQWFVGGEIGCNIINNNTKDIKKELANNDYLFKNIEIGFIVANKIGYYFNDKFALGLYLKVGYGFYNRHWVNPDTYKDEYYEEKNRGYSINSGIYPFIRYSVFTYKKFFLILEGRSGTETTYSFIDREENWTGAFLASKTHKSKQKNIAINIFNLKPIIGFNLTDNFQIETGINFLGLGYTINIKKEKYDGINDIMAETEANNVKDIQHNFDFGFKSSNILSIAQLNVSVIYKFKNKNNKERR